ncbi:MAG: aminoacyl-tRNA hydrolase [bacterium]|nr:aminoacyl-tRNA hydrolase [bacterium]
MAVKKFLVAGLGNPGPVYELTRHNAGFYFLDAFADKQGWRLGSLKMQGLYSQGRLQGAQVFCVKPQTFMNRSGQCLRAYLDYFGISLDGLLVLYDDLDLAEGRIKVARGGGAGGHNGVRSIIDHVGSRDFARIRVGIGRPPGGEATAGGYKMEGYVLAPVGAAGRKLWDERVDLVAEAIELFVDKGIEHCMNSINGRTAG